MLPPEAGAFLFFVLGAVLGSFANVIILRLPAGENIALPASHCAACNAPVAWYDNLPLISWIVLRGRCRKCGARFSFRYWVVEFLTAVLFSLAFLKLGWTFSLLETLIFFFGLVVVTFIDFDHYLLPDVFTLPGTALGILGSFLNPQRTVIDSALGAFFGAGFLWSLAYLYALIRKEEGLGMGDVKLLAWIGAVLGWSAIPFVILTSSLSGSVVGLAVAYRQKKGLKTMIPYGPYLAFGAVLYRLAGESLAQG
ncbi:MAG: prepilin peptidase, partial [Bdellovibrio sp.]